MSGLSRRGFLYGAGGAGVAWSAGSAVFGPRSGPFGPGRAGAQATLEYDDGSDVVPAGAVGDAERVLVIGAGWAGLTAANALRNGGVECVVLEGRDRIGGRAHTADVGGFPIDLGCSWIHDPIGNPMVAYADQAGVGRVNADVFDEFLRYRYWDGSLGRELDALEKSTTMGRAFTFAVTEASLLSQELGPDASVRDGAELWMDRNLYSGDRRRWMEFNIRLLSELAQTESWERLSLHESVNRDLEYSGTGLGEWPVGGYRTLTAAMAGGSDIRLGIEVERIEHGEGGVVVHATETASGEPVVFEGSHVVVTVPLGVLKAGAIVFDPPLPAERRAAIDRLGFGHIEKVALCFDEPFWHDDSHNHLVHVSGHDDFELPLWIDASAVTGDPCLMVFASGPAAKRFHALGPTGAVDTTMARLAEMLGSAVPDPVDAVFTDWQGSRFTRGAYTSILAGNTNQDLVVAGEPVGGRLLFAGEHTDINRYAHADGAMRSGIREAKRLLRQPAVMLSASAAGVAAPQQSPAPSSDPSTGSSAGSVSVGADASRLPDTGTAIPMGLGLAAATIGVVAARRAALGGPGRP